MYTQLFSLKNTLWTWPHLKLKTTTTSYVHLSNDANSNVDDMGSVPVFIKGNPADGVCILYSLKLHRLVFFSITQSCNEWSYVGCSYLKLSRRVISKTIGSLFEFDQKTRHICILSICVRQCIHSWVRNNTSLWKRWIWFVIHMYT